MSISVEDVGSVDIFVVLLFIILICLMFLNEEENDDDANEEKTGKHCPERDSCNFGRSSRGSLEMDWRQRNCFCDADCALYGDCCIDARAFDPVEQRDNFERFEIR